MSRTIVQDRQEALRVKASTNGYHPALPFRQAGQVRRSVGKEEVISLLWVVLWIAIVLAALVMATGTIAMLVRSVMSLFT
jgi:hypothetical protein